MQNIFLVLFIISAIWAVLTVIKTLARIIKIIFEDKYQVSTEMAKMEIDRQISEEAEKSGNTVLDKTQLLNKLIGVPSSHTEYKIRKAFPIILKGFVKIIAAIWIAMFLATATIANAPAQIQQKLGLASFGNTADYFIAFFSLSILCGILLGAFSVFISLIFIFYKILTGMHKGKVPTQGVIVGYAEQRHSDGAQRMYHSKVAFTLNGETITFTSKIGQSWIPKKDKTVTVLFNPENPQEAEVKTIIPFIILTVFVLFFAFMFFNFISSFVFRGQLFSKFF